jgi:hypothetical protein
LQLQAEPDTDAIKAIRALLKVALRRFGLRCIDVRECAPTHVEDKRARALTMEDSMSAFSDRIRGQKTGLFKVADFAGGREATLTIDHLEESVAMFDREIDLLHFRETKQQLSLNQTNSEFLLNALGDDPAKWAGQSIVLYLGTYTYGDESGNTIKIKLRAEKQPTASKPAPATTAKSGGDTTTTSTHSPDRKHNGGHDLDDEIPF